MKPHCIFRFLIIGLLLVLANNSFSSRVEAAFAGPVIIIHEEIQNEKVTAFIPQISGLTDKTIENSLNNIIRSDIDHGMNSFLNNWDSMIQGTPENIRKGIHFWSSYAIKMNKNGILSLTITEYMYTGGAHGNTATYAYNMNVGTGQVYKLQDVFRPKADYRAQLEGIIKDDIAAKKNMVYWFKQLGDEQTFYLTEEGLVIYFQPYEIGPWSAGVPRFIIPYSKLGHMTNNNLPLY